MSEWLLILCGVMLVFLVLAYIVFCAATMIWVMFGYIPDSDDSIFSKILMVIGLIVGFSLTLYGSGLINEDVSIRIEGLIATTIIGIAMWVWGYRRIIYEYFKNKSKKKLKQLEKKQEDPLNKAIQEYTNNYRRY